MCQELDNLRSDSPLLRICGICATGRLGLELLKCFKKCGKGSCTLGYGPLCPHVSHPHMLHATTVNHCTGSVEHFGSTSAHWQLFCIAFAYQVFCGNR